MYQATCVLMQIRRAANRASEGMQEVVGSNSIGFGVVSYAEIAICDYFRLF